MKNIGLICVSALLGGLMLMIVMSMEGRNNRNMELKMNLPSVVEATIENMMLDKKYNINNYNEFLADFVSNMSVNLDTDSDIMVKVLKADKEKGLLAIKVIEEYSHPNGNRGTVECERTVILNKLPEATEETYTVKFFLKKEDMASGRPYKVCQVRAENVVATPANPISTDGVFSGWLDPNDYAADFSIPVTGDLMYYAAWN